MDEIKIQKTTLMLLAGLALAIMAGGYIVFANAPGTTDGNAAGTAAADLGSAPPPGPLPPQNAPAPVSAPQVQDVYVKALSTGTYDKTEVAVQKGVPVRFHFSAESGAGCGRVLVMEEFGVSLVSRNGGEQVAEFTPQDAGTYEYHCGMHMFVGRMVVS